jgi:hypothetical protein
MNGTNYINFPVPESLGKEWRALCEAFGIAYQDDLAGLLEMAKLMPRDAHMLLNGAALGTIPKSLSAPVLERIRLELAEIFPEGPDPEP